MAQNVTIAGASFSDVPSIEVPKTGGGTASFVDSSDADATAADILSGKTAYVDGVKLTGTGSGATLQSKSVTYTSNGSATITPDSGYDGLSSVDVTVNVSGYQHYYFTAAQAGSKSFYNRWTGSSINLYYINATVSLPFSTIETIVCWHSADYSYGSTIYSKGDCAICRSGYTASNSIATSTFVLTSTQILIPVSKSSKSGNYYIHVYGY